MSGSRGENGILAVKYIKLNILFLRKAPTQILIGWKLTFLKTDSREQSLTSSMMLNPMVMFMGANSGISFGNSPNSSEHWPGKTHRVQ